MSAVLSYANCSRGTDSWGFAGSHQRRSWEVKRGLKRIDPQARHMATFRSLMAHTRHATKGAITVRNAHPYRRGNVILAHNGAVWNYESLKDAEAEAPQVDSELIATRLGADGDISDLDGYGVFTWIDLRSGEALLCMPSARGEIALANIHGEGEAEIRGCVYSSDEKPLVAALTSAGLSFSLLQETPGQVYTLTPAGVFQSARARLTWRKEEKMTFKVYSGGKSESPSTGAVHSSQASPPEPMSFAKKDDDAEYQAWLKQYCKDQYGLDEDEIQDFVSSGWDFKA